MDSPKAGFLRRLAALTVDYVLLQIVGGAVTYPLDKKFGLTTDETLKQVLSGNADLRQIMIFLLLYTALLTILWGFYFTYFIGSTGQTPGKKLLGIMVVRTNGSPMDYKTAFNRFIGYTISGSVFLLGFAWALFDPNKQTWHDKMAQTIVVKTTNPL